MKYRKLGKTGVEVSVLCAGCMTAGRDPGTYGPTDDRDTIAAINAYLDAGVNFLDTSESYSDGESETILGRALGSRRKQLILSTKVSLGHLAPAELKRACEGSLRRLKTDWIDLYQIHWPDPAVPVADSIAAMLELQAEGKIRFIGVSNFCVGYLADAVAATAIAGNQVCYSLLWRPIEHAIQPFCVEHDISILCYSPMCQGLLTGKFRGADEVPPLRARSRLFDPARPKARHGDAGFEEGTFAAIEAVRDICKSAHLPMGQVALAWALAQPAVAAVIAGARRAEQAAENARAAEIELPDDVIAQLNAATDKVKQYVGANADMWESRSRIEKVSAHPASPGVAP